MSSPIFQTTTQAPGSSLPCLWSQREVENLNSNSLAEEPGLETRISYSLLSINVVETDTDRLTQTYDQIQRVMV